MVHPLGREPQIAALRHFLERLGGSRAPYFDEFAALFSSARLAKGEYFARAGVKADCVAFVGSGIARMFYCRDDGKEFNKDFVSAPDFMSALESLITGEPSRLTLQALTAMDLQVASYARVTEFFERDIFWQRVGRRIIEQVYVKKVRREASLLMNTAAERYAEFLSEHRALADRVPDYHCAAYLGITPEALSRLKRNARKPTPS